MEIKIFAFIGVIVFMVGGLILASIQLFEKDINKKIDKLNDKIDDIGYKTNDIDPCYQSIYTKLINIQQQIEDLTPNIENTNDNEPESEK